MLPQLPQSFDLTFARASLVDVCGGNGQQHFFFSNTCRPWISSIGHAGEIIN